MPAAVGSEARADQVRRTQGRCSAPAAGLAGAACCDTMGVRKVGVVPVDGCRMMPVGRVVQGRARGDEGDGWEESLSEIELAPAWVDALEGIEGFSHVWVLWQLDTVEGDPVPLRVHPQRRQDLPLVGLFATRSPQRPNPIALTAVRLVARNGGRLVVQGLDAFEGSAILDVKPYLRRGDLIDDARQPEWLECLWRERQVPGSRTASRRCRVLDKEAIEAQLDELAKLAPQKVAGLSAVVGLDLAGEGGGQWTLRFVNGAMTWAEGLDPAVEATLKLAAKDWDALGQKKLNPMTAFMTGRLKVVGNMATIMKLQPLLQ